MSVSVSGVGFSCIEIGEADRTQTRLSARVFSVRMMFYARTFTGGQTAKLADITGSRAESFGRRLLLLL